MSILLGCIADDFTGATDLANTLVRQGMRCIQLLGTPGQDDELHLADVDAVVIALKSRTIPVDDAKAQSLDALAWLMAQGCKQYFFKYCSTFDSTDSGNIGPVADALLDRLDESFTIACPAFPENARTIFNGYLFVGDVLLNESGMQNHPLTPMKDANLVRVLQAQTTHKVGLVPWRTVTQGVSAVQNRINVLRQERVRYAITDAAEDDNLFTVGRACEHLKLITGGSGIALGLPENFRRQGQLKPNPLADRLQSVTGASAVLAGSCSQATQEQVRVMAEHAPAYRIDPLRIDSDDIVDEALSLARKHLKDGPILIYSTSTPEEVAEVQAELGREHAGELVERTMAKIAVALRNEDVRRFVIAGGETSGAVVSALGVRALRIGRQIDPGVPWTQTTNEPRLALALKSGNFGTPDFFTKALAVLDDKL